MSGRPYFFPDNTVLINVAILDHVEFLDRFVQKRGRWCASIEYEWRRSHRALDLSSKFDVQVRNMCGQPIQPDHGDYVDIQLLQEQMRAPGDRRIKHLGEAETIVMIRRRAELMGSIFLTDDAGARSQAIAEPAVNRCLGTTELLAYFEVAGWITRNVVHADLLVLQEAGRHVRPSVAREYDQLADGLLLKMKRAGLSS